MWWLTNGRHVPKSIALRVTTNPQVIPVGDALLHSSSRARFWPPAIAQDTNACLPASVTFYDLVAGGIATAMSPKPKPVFAILDIPAELLRRARRDPPRAQSHGGATARSSRYVPANCAPSNAVAAHLCSRMTCVRGLNGVLQSR